MAIVLGLNAKLYRNTGTYATPVWDEVPNVRDLSTNLEKTDADVTTRGGNGWRQRAVTLKDGTVDFGMVWDTADADFTAIKDAFFNDTQVDFWVLDGDSTTTGNQGLRAEMEIGNFTRNENLEEALTVDVSIFPGRGVSGNPPEWKVVP